MKKYCYLLFCLTATLLACDNGIFSDDDKPAPVSLDYPADPIAPEGGSISMTIRATGRWTVSKTTSWLTVTPAAGVGEQTVTISAPSNKVEKKDTPNRKTRIYIIAGAFTETIDVVQSGYLQPTPQAPQVSKSEQPCMTTISIAAPVEHAVAYKWYCDSVETLTDTTLTFEVIQSGTHSYAVAGVNITGNVGEWSEAVEITTSVCQPPQEGIGAITGEDANSCSVATGKNTVTLTAPKIPYAAGYLWYLDGALVDSGASKTFTARSSGTYTVRGANSEG
ncbi:MAG: BACON domain-containing protein, partial [Prevotellaceae bacterium]|nr:BACON domain-containing protein [Prevotellaceae bacterium]